MSDFTDALIDGPQPSRRIPYWKSKFEEQQELVRKKNLELTKLRGENERLLAVIVAAPHHIHCRCQWPYNAGACNCWKRAVLAGKERA